MGGSCYQEKLISNPLLKECKYLEPQDGKLSARILNVKYTTAESLGHSLEEITKPPVFTYRKPAEPYVKTHSPQPHSLAFP